MDLLWYLLPILRGIATLILLQLVAADILALNRGVVSRRNGIVALISDVFFLFSLLYLWTGEAGVLGLLAIGAIWAATLLTKSRLAPPPKIARALIKEVQGWPWRALRAVPRALFSYRIAVAGNLVVIPIPVASILYILGYQSAAFSFLPLVGLGILLFFAFVFSEDENNNAAASTA